jgi:hypothetical protein
MLCVFDLISPVPSIIQPLLILRVYTTQENKKTLAIVFDRGLIIVAIHQIYIWRLGHGKNTIMFSLNTKNYLEMQVLFHMGIPSNRVQAGADLAILKTGRPPGLDGIATPYL